MTTLTKPRRRSRLTPQAKKLAHSACGLLRLAGLQPTAEAAGHVIRSVPRTHEESDEGPEGFCAYCLVAAERAPMQTEEESLRFESLARYFLDYLPTLGRRRRGQLEAAAAGVLEGMDMASPRRRPWLMGA